jgi:hypothetical protein
VSCEAFGPSGHRCVLRSTHASRHQWVVERPIPRTFEGLRQELLARGLLEELKALQHAVKVETGHLVEELRESARITQAVRDEAEETSKRRFAADIVRWRMTLRSSKRATLEPAEVLQCRRAATAWALACLLERR